MMRTFVRSVASSRLGRTGLQNGTKKCRPGHVLNPPKGSFASTSLGAGLGNAPRADRPSGGKVEGLTLLISFLYAIVSLTAWASDYTIGPGDVIRIDAYEAEQVSGKFRVDSEGYIKHFILGKLKVGGKTLSQINADLERILAKGFLKDPKVNVIVEEYHSREVYVLGEVARPGSYGLKGDSLLLDVILQAGGPSANAGDVISILRKNSGTIGERTTTTGVPLTHLTVNVARLLLDGELSQNIPVRPGDVIFLPRSDREIKTFFVVGQVKTPGAYKLKDGYTVLNAILDAGGFSKYAKGNGTKLIRGKGEKQEVFVLKMEDVMEEGDREKDMTLKDGDLIVVPSGLF